MNMCVVCRRSIEQAQSARQVKNVIKAGYSPSIDDCGNLRWQKDRPADIDAARERRVDLCTSCQNTGKEKV